jgi:hypothetical protein
MKITIDNYEAYLLDKMEGTLTDKLLAELQLFLKNHPELNQDMEEMEQAFLYPENISFKHKESLKMRDFKLNSINENNLEDFCIAFYENILTDDKIIELLSFCKRKKYDNVLKLYEKTYLKPGKIKFPDKTLLYRKKKIVASGRTIILRVTSLAASIALFISVYTYFSGKNMSEKENLHIPNPGNKHYIQAFQTGPKILKESKTIIKQQEYTAERNKINRSIHPEPGITDTLPIRERINDQMALLPEPELQPIKTSSHYSSLKQVETRSDPVKIENDQTEEWPTFATKTITKIKSETIDKMKNNGKISVLKIFKAGIKEINNVTELNIQLFEKTDSIGNITALSLEPGTLEYHRNKGNKN